MKGRLSKLEYNQWIVTYIEETEGSSDVLETIDLQLHPEDVNDLKKLEQRFDNLEARIAANPDVEFEIVKHQKLTGIATYAKLKNHDKAN